MPFAVKMGTGGTTGFLGRQEKTQRAAKRFAKRRRVNPGFPVTKPFKTRHEIEEYLSGDKITCLLCGRQMKRLAVHLPKIHGMSVDAYRMKYGLPWGIGVASKPTRDAYRTATKKRVDEDPDMWREIGEIGRATSNKGKRNRQTPEFLAKEYGERALSIHKRVDSFTPDDMAEFLRRIETGRTPGEVSKDADMPGRTTWSKYRRANPLYEARFRQVWDSLSFEVQARGQRMGPRFRAELRRLYDAGFSDKKAAKILGVTAMTCNRITKNWRATDNPPGQPPALPGNSTPLLRE